MEKGDEEREQRMIDEQIKRAREARTETEEIDNEAKQLQRAEGEKITLNFELWKQGCDHETSHTAS